MLLVDNARPDPLGDMGRFRDAYDTFIRTTGVVVGITRTDVRALPARQEYLDLLLARDLRCPTFTVDARSPADVSLLVRSLLYCLDPQVQAS